MTIPNTDPRDAYRDRILRLLIEQMEKNEETREGVADIKLEMKSTGLSGDDIGGVILRARQDLAAIKQEAKPVDKKAKQETREQIAASLSPFAGLPLVDAALDAVRKRQDRSPIAAAVARARADA